MTHNPLSRCIRYAYNVVLRKRRVRRIVNILLPLFPEGSATVLDLGCGTGEIAHRIHVQRPELQFSGLEITPPQDTFIPVHTYDGKTIPHADKSFDYVMLIAVLHHLDEYKPLLEEARRVARKGIILLDHQNNSRLDFYTLCIMDYPGNVPFGVYTPYNFISTAAWFDLFDSLQLEPKEYSDRIRLFGFPLEPVFGRRLHFICRLEDIS